MPVDIAAERKALGLSVNEPLRSGTHARPGAPAPAMIVNAPTHAQEHAVEVQIPFLQTVLGPDLTIVPLNAGDATPQEVGDVLRALWGGPETVIVISSDLSHYHPHEVAARWMTRPLRTLRLCICRFTLAGPVAHTRSTAFWMC